MIVALVLGKLFVGIGSAGFGFNGEFIEDTIFGIKDGKVFYVATDTSYETIDFFFSSKNPHYTEVEEADLATFKPYDAANSRGVFMASDKNHVFWKSEIIHGIRRAEATYLGCGYIKDSKNVYFGNEPIAGADIETFQPLVNSSEVYSSEYPQFAKDRTTVYYQHLPIPKADPNSIQLVMGSSIDYLIDQNAVFLRNEELKGANPENFVVHSIGYSLALNKEMFYGADQKLHFINGNPFPKSVGGNQVDFSKFHPLQVPNSDVKILFFSDEKNVYYYDKEDDVFETT